VYDLRHSFGTKICAETGDPKAVQELLMHSSQKTTARFTQGAVSTRLRLAVKGFDQAVPAPRNGWQSRLAVRRPIAK
jgi:site-specific recombinase XerD